MKLEPPWNILLGEPSLIQASNGTVIVVTTKDTKKLWQLAWFSAQAYQLAASHYPTINGLIILDDTEAISDMKEINLVNIAPQRLGQ